MVRCWGLRPGREDSEEGVRDSIHPQPLVAAGKATMAFSQAQRLPRRSPRTQRTTPQRRSTVWKGGRTKIKKKSNKTNATNRPKTKRLGKKGKAKPSQSELF